MKLNSGRFRCRRGFSFSATLISCIFLPRSIFTMNVRATLIAIMCFLIPALSNAEGVIIGPIYLSLGTEKHASEGALLTLNGDLVNIFRLTSDNGDHVSNSGNVVSRTSADLGFSWTEPEVIFSGDYDFRNARAGVVGGRIVLFFREYDAIEKTPIRLLYAVRDLNGLWSAPKPVPSLPQISDYYGMWIDNIHEIAGELVFTLHAVGFFQIYTASVSEKMTITDMQQVFSLDRRDSSVFSGIDEPEMVVLRDGTTFVMFRDDSTEWRPRPYIYMVSHGGFGDFGELKISNLCVSDNAKAVAPHLIVLENRELLYLGSYRQLTENPGDLDKLCFGRVIFGEAGDVHFEPQNTIERPMTSSGLWSRLYGYPISARISDNTWLITFTDSAHDAERNTEKASIFQFLVSLSSDENTRRDGLDSFVTLRIERKPALDVASGASATKMVESIPFSKIPNALGGLASDVKLIAQVDEDRLLASLNTSLETMIDDLLLHRSNESNESNDPVFQFRDLSGDQRISGGDVLRVEAAIRNEPLADLYSFNLDGRILDVSDPFTAITLMKRSTSVGLSLLGGLYLSEREIREMSCSLFEGENTFALQPGASVDLKQNNSHKSTAGHIFQLQSADPRLILENGELSLAGALLDEIEITQATITISSTSCSQSVSLNIVLLPKDVDADGLPNELDSDMDGDGFKNTAELFFWDHARTIH